MEHVLKPEVIDLGFYLRSNTGCMDTKQSPEKNSIYFEMLSV